MSRYKLTLRPRGVIPRDLALTLKMQKLAQQAAAVEAVGGSPPLLHIDVGYPAWGENRFSWLLVSTDDIQSADLTVTVTIADPHVFTIYTGSTFANTATGLIPAGSSRVHFLTHTPFGFDGGTTMATAVADGYDDATASMSSQCAHLLVGIRYQALSIDATTFTRQLSSGVVNAMTLAHNRSAIIIGQLDLTEMCHEDTVTWDVSATGGGDVGLIVGAFAGTPKEINLWAMGDLLGGSAYSSGATIRVKCMLNAVLASTPLADYTFTFP